MVLPCGAMRKLFAAHHSAIAPGCRRALILQNQQGKMQRFLEDIDSSTPEAIAASKSKSKGMPLSSWEAPLFSSRSRTVESARIFIVEWLRLE